MERNADPSHPSNIESEKPTFDIEFAPVYNGILEAERIVQILKFIVAKQL